MKKILLLLLLLFAVACGGPEAPVTETTDHEPETAVSTPETMVEEETTTEVAELPSSSTHADFTPASTPADAGIVRDFDQVKGATDPVVTIIEYGDYQ